LIHFPNLLPNSYWHQIKACSTLPLLLSKLGDKPDSWTTGLTDYERQSGSSRKLPATRQRGQRKEALPETGLPLRARF
jgi:hypothetical protein